MTNQNTIELCPCGRPLHYSDPTTQGIVELWIRRLGPTVDVVTPCGTWAVPRHYIALHGLNSAELEGLAARYQWERKR